MTGAAPRSATPNAGDGKSVSENGQRGAENSRVGRFGRFRPTARCFPSVSETEFDWKVTCRGLTLAGGKPKGESRF